MLIKAAINGGRTKTEHKAVPISPEEQAAAVAACLKAGANAIHLHVRSTSLDGRSHLRDESPGSQSSNLPSHEGIRSEKESLYAEDVSRTLSAVKSVASITSIGVSTGAWILPDTAERLQAVAAWEVLPGFASVNFSEDGAVELAQLLLSRGVNVEAGLCDADAAKVFLESGLTLRCIRVLLEPQEQEMERALETVVRIEEVLDSGVVKFNQMHPRVLHGTESTAWAMMAEAIARGYDVRIGLEDTLVLPDGRMARDNAELVREAVRRVRN